jgi:copper chaperone CopZ
MKRGNMNLMKNALTLFALVASLMQLPLFAEIYEIRLTIENMDCHFCARSLKQVLSQVPEITTSKIWPLEGMGLVQWKKETPFKSADLLRAFRQTQFFLKSIDVDVEGKIVEKKGATILESTYDGSVFYIDNRQDQGVRSLKDGQIVRIQGRVVNQRGFNFLRVAEVLPEIEPKENSKALSCK